MQAVLPIQNTGYIYFCARLDRAFIELLQCKIIIHNYLHSMQLGTTAKQSA